MPPHLMGGIFVKINSYVKSVTLKLTQRFSRINKIRKKRNFSLFIFVNYYYDT